MNLSIFNEIDWSNIEKNGKQHGVLSIFMHDETGGKNFSRFLTLKNVFSLRCKIFAKLLEFEKF